MPSAGLFERRLTMIDSVFAARQNFPWRNAGLLGAALSSPFEFTLATATNLTRGSLRAGEQ
jgi:hypothetical protein